MTDVATNLALRHMAEIRADLPGAPLHHRVLPA